jgi:hypothetical protein
MRYSFLKAALLFFLGTVAVTITSGIFYNNTVRNLSVCKISYLTKTNGTNILVGNCGEGLKSYPLTSFIDTRRKVCLAKDSKIIGPCDTTNLKVFLALLSLGTCLSFVCLLFMLFDVCFLCFVAEVTPTPSETIIFVQPVRDIEQPEQPAQPLPTQPKTIIAKEGTAIAINIDDKMQKIYIVENPTYED